MRQCDNLRSPGPRIIAIIICEGSNYTMSNTAAAFPVTAGARGGLSAWVARHPLFSYFFWSFAGTWLLFGPISLSARGLGWLPIDLGDALTLILFLGATYTGPFLSAILVTALMDGRKGVRALLARIVRWRVGVVWYLIPFLGYPIVTLAGVAALAGPGVLSALPQRWPLLFSLYIPNILIGFFIPTLGEETGWRGFALPRLQASHGPLVGTLILGAMHALWHLPAYFVRGLILPNGFEWNGFLGNSLAVVALTFVWTWLFNNSRGSILLATFVHCCSNGTSALVPQLTSNLVIDPWGGFKIFLVVALVVIGLTRGRLSYEKYLKEQRERPSQPALKPMLTGERV